MTEPQIELEVERRTNRLDLKLRAHELTQAEYDHAIDEVNVWALAQYKARGKAAWDSAVVSLAARHLR